MTIHLMPVDTPRSTRKRWVLPAALALIALALLAAGLFANINRGDDLRRARELARAHSLAKTAPVAPLNLVKPLTPEEAVKQNEERPFDASPDTPARQFKLRADEGSRDRALECLTQAVYYEAATEGADGERAVAQVVLNRMRHPGFPASVCGVVYEGSNLPTGCQFTFTCDGSLTRTPIPAVWTRARAIALQALQGHVFAPVGHSTHYHADYVLPYWADSLAKQVQIGHHIFYRLRGGLGTDAAFSQHYAGAEPTPPPPPSPAAVEAADQAQALLDSGLAGDQTPQPPRVLADAAGIAAATAPKQELIADSSKSALLLDNGAAPTGAPKKKRSRDDCPAGDDKQVMPAAPNDLHAGLARTDC